MRITARVANVEKIGSPSYLMVTAEASVPIQGSQRIVRNQFIVHQNDHLERPWPISVGERMEIVFSFIEAGA